MKVLPILLVFCLPLLSTAQYQLSGIVVNGNDSMPLAGASVFINNASKGTVTNEAGKFTISGITVTNFELVISFVNYQTLVVKITSENINRRFRIQMEPKPSELQEVVIGPVLKDGWETWGKTFTEFFIGTSENATHCIIKNPKVLRFSYNKKKEQLRVYAVDKLRIENNALGLIIDYQLEDFIYDGKSRMVSYYGYTSFQPMSTNRKHKSQVWKDKRMDAYNGSLLHFLRAVYNNKVTQAGFEISQLIRLYKSDTATRPYYDSIMAGKITVFDTSQFAIQLMKSATFEKDPIIYIIGKQPVPISSVRFDDSISKNVYVYFHNNLQLVYKNGFEKEEYAHQNGLLRKGKQHPETILSLPNDRAIIVENNGLFYEPLDLFTEGYIAWQKIAEMLPSDYQPGD